jgi:hypothetical protein
MYSTLPLKRLLGLLGLPPLGIFVVLAVLSHAPADFSSGWSLAKSVVGWWTVFIIVFGAGSKWWAPWRVVWRIPGMERYFFPDLNGTWDGTTSSNWPSVKAMFDTYEKRAKPGHAGALDQTPLQVDAIEFKITASFFRFRIEAKLSNTGATSHSVSARVSWNDNLERYEVWYLYSQGTPSPKITDDASHLGAASLVLDMDARVLKGEYWTKRSWRSGLNTAGLIEVKRIKR